MGEFVSAHDVSVADLATAGPAATITKEIVLPGGASRWTLLVVPKDSGAPGGDPTLKLQYDVGGEAFDTNPSGTPISVPLNQATVVTREDVVSKLKAVFVTPADPQHDGGYLVRLYVQRSN